MKYTLARETYMTPREETISIPYGEVGGHIESAVWKAKETQRRADRGWCTVVYEGDITDDGANIVAVAWFGPRMGIHVTRFPEREGKP